MIPLNKFIFRGIRDDIEGEDVQEAFFRYMEENPMAGVILDEDEIVEYDADGNAIIPDRKVNKHVICSAIKDFEQYSKCSAWLFQKMIDPLPYLDHRQVDYEKFRRNFHVEHDEIAALTDAKVAELRNTLGIRVRLQEF